MRSWDETWEEKEFWEYEDEEEVDIGEDELDWKSYIFGDDRDKKHEKKKYRAALYIRAHYDELMKDEDYQKAYYKIIDEYVRAYAYAVEHRSIAVVSEAERRAQNGYLDEEISSKWKKKINKCKDDAIYIVEWVKAGKSLIVYK